MDTNIVLIVLYLVTVLVYSAMFIVMSTASRKSTENCARSVGIIALLCLPINIGGDVFTVMGNAVSEGSVYSIFSLYQKTEQDAVTGIGLAGYQEAGRDAMTIFGIAGYQEAGQNAVTGIGLAGYQKVGKKKRAFGALNFGDSETLIK